MAFRKRSRRASGKMIDMNNPLLCIMRSRADILIAAQKGKQLKSIPLYK